MIRRKLSCILFLTILASNWEQLYANENVSQTEKEEVRPKVSAMAAIQPRLDRLGYVDFLKEVFETLRNDDDFSSKLKKEQENLQDGELISEKLAEHFEVISEKTAAELTQLKRKEMRKLLKLADKLWRKGFREDQVRKFVRESSAHLYLNKNQLKESDTFTDADLRILIRDTNRRLHALDLDRKQHFKEYEMQKKLELEELKKRRSAEEQVEIDKRMEELYMHHKRRKPAHLPLSKNHILAVWEERDHMDKEQLNLKAFFHLHDLDSNLVWDESEIKVLLEKEVSKLHDPTSPNFDPNEKEEELERMREYVFRQVDENKDGFVGVAEFLHHSQRIGQSDMEFWESLGNKPQFTEEEYEKYASENREEVNKLIDQGLLTMPVVGVVKHFLKP